MGYRGPNGESDIVTWSPPSRSCYSSAGSEANKDTFTVMG